MDQIFKQRIGFTGDLRDIAERVCIDFNLGEYSDCKIMMLGYEDFNFALTTTTGKFFVKIFSTARTLEDCKRNVEVVVAALAAGVNTPKLYKSEQGNLHVMDIDSLKLRMCVMDLIDGKDLFTSKEIITNEDIIEITRQASLINSVEIKPDKIYDAWAITNFELEYEKKAQYLEPDDLELLQQLLEKFRSLKIETLPHCFVHGDIIKTNVVKDAGGKIWIVDFSVSNDYPRIQELAVLGCDILFNKESAEESNKNLEIALNEYQKKMTLTPKELVALPIYILLAHAMHVLCTTYEKKVNGNMTNENKAFYELGRAGVRMTAAVLEKKNSRFDTTLSPS